MILIIGIPNSGKTTYSARFDNVIHFDDVWSRDIYHFLADKVKANNDICIEGVFEKAKNRKLLVEQSKCKNICIWLDTPIDICLERERMGRKRSEHLVIWANEDFEPPTLDEGWDEIIIIRGDNEQRINRKTKN